MTTGGPDAETPDAGTPDAGTLDAETRAAETLAAGGLEWLLGTARAEGPGLAWAGTAGSGEFDPSLYSGGAGIVITLLEAHRHFRDDRYADAALRGSRAIAAAVDGWDISSLYFGLTGMAFALRSVGNLLGDAAADRAADHALEIVRSPATGTPSPAAIWSSRRSSPVTWRRGRPRTRPGCAGRTRSTGSPPARCRRAAAGPWAARGSSANCCGSPGPPAGPTRPTLSPGQTILPPGHVPGPQPLPLISKPGPDSRSSCPLV